MLFETISTVMKHIVAFVLITMLIGTVSAQSYSDAFDEAFGRDDVVAQRKALALWQQSAPEDVNLFIARYNFYANRAMGQNDGEGAAFLADSALATIDEGIALYPDRLDLRFGKIYFLGELGRWDAFADEIDRMLSYSVQMGHQWEFPNVDEQLVKDLFVEGIADYMATMFASIADTTHLTAADSLMARRIQGVAKRTVQLFPGDLPATYMLALSHLMLNENDKAYRYLMRAEGIDNANQNVLKLLVKVCRLLGKASQAAEYQQRIATIEN